MYDSVARNAPPTEYKDDTANCNRATRMALQ